VINITTRTTTVSNVQLDDNILSGYDCWKRKGLSRRRKLKNVGPETTSSGIPFQIRGPETLKVRLPTVDSQNIGTTKSSAIGNICLLRYKRSTVIRNMNFSLGIRYSLITTSPSNSKKTFYLKQSDILAGRPSANPAQTRSECPSVSGG